MKNAPPTPYTVFYDGNCIVCDTEIRHYLSLQHQGQLQAVNIADPDFDPSQYGPSYDDFMAQMHLQSADGRWHRGVDAFTLVWHTLPGCHWRLMVWLAESRLLRPLARLGYRLFAANRHRLPRHSCSDGRCELKGPFDST